ncbi:MAG: nitroreductase family protein [Clostridia bacterium]|nr:nitroreductase family protein [Clostridia bacterium]
MDFERVITERYSVRSFKPEHLPRETVEKILAAAHKAPTGCNNQPQRILVLNTDRSLEKLRGCTGCHFNAPTAFLVCYSKKESWRRSWDGALAAPVDAAIVATHMMLAAENEGVGCCWVMSFNPAAMRESFAIPEDIEPLALLTMGYPADDASPRDMHFSTRPIDEVVFYDSF